MTQKELVCVIIRFLFISFFVLAEEREDDFEIVKNAFDEFLAICEADAKIEGKLMFSSLISKMLTFYIYSLECLAEYRSGYLDLLSS